MNIKEAKAYIKDSVQVYLKKDEFGDYRIPVVRQRPIFLLGAPGIGKTAIMEQIASELGIALVSYSMTHHTRQSALGLPFITKKEYNGKTYDVSEYTMSEIIASIYETMEQSGVKEGILFLDEINCVSETLAPSMLQFLQYKVFGRHRVPEGWVIVTAGNPPEYNKSVREFDVVTLDRLKVLSVEADYNAWRSYAVEKGIHGAVLNFLELKQEYFYHMETTAKGRSYVTPRGWEDLSEILRLYEEEKLPIDESLVGQYLRSETIVKEFCVYYDLYNKYRMDYDIDTLLSEGASDEMVKKAKEAAFDERISLLGMLLEEVQQDMKNCVETADYLTVLAGILKKGKEAEEISRFLEDTGKERRNILEEKEHTNALSDAERRKEKRILRFLEEVRTGLGRENIPAPESFAYLKEKFSERTALMQKESVSAGEKLRHLFQFTETAFSDGNEMLILVTELTVNQNSARFIGMFGSEDYQKYNQKLLISERRKEIKQEVIGELLQKMLL